MLPSIYYIRYDKWDYIFKCYHIYINKYQRSQARISCISFSILVKTFKHDYITTSICMSTVYGHHN